MGAWNCATSFVLPMRMCRPCAVSRYSFVVAMPLIISVSCSSVMHCGAANPPVHESTMNGSLSSVALMHAACAFATVVAWSAAPPSCCTTVRSMSRPLMPPHSLTISANTLSMSTGSPRLNRYPCGESPGASGASIATTEIESAVTPGADASSPVCSAVSSVQNAVVDVNGDDAGSAVTCVAAASAAGAASGSSELPPPPHAPTPMAESASANVDNPTSPYRARMVIPPVSHVLRRR